MRASVFALLLMTLIVVGAIDSAAEVALALHPQWSLGAVLVREPGALRYPMRRVVGHWTTSEGVLAEQLECGHEIWPQG